MLFHFAAPRVHFSPDGVEGGGGGSASDPLLPPSARPRPSGLTHLPKAAPKPPSDSAEASPAQVAASVPGAPVAKAASKDSESGIQLPATPPDPKPGVQWDDNAPLPDLGPGLPSAPPRTPGAPAPSASAPQAATAAGGPPTPRRVSLRQLLREAVERGASDLHLTRGVPPMIRLDGYLTPLDYPSLTREAIEKLILSALNDVQKEKFEAKWELDVSMEYPDAGRFRVNIHRQRGGTEAAFRVVNDVIQPLRRLGLPGVVEEVARRHNGLVIVTGPTGSGKTTTLAAIVDQINNERQVMIVTIEDPIEYVHHNKRSIIKQREVNSDTRSFTDGLRHVLRQDPDVIVIGEMRDLETIQTALISAETGHLVFTTLHTPDAMQTMDRMIDVFPPNQQEQARLQVANTLLAVIAQQLIPVPGNRGRVVAVEILIATNAVKKIIRTGKTEQLYTVMQTGWDKGMITMDKSLKTLYQQGLISFEDAISRCAYPQEFDNI